MKILATAMGLVVLTGATAWGQELTKTDLIGLKKAGRSDADLLKEVSAAKRVANLSDDDVIELVAAGVGEDVINAMLKAAPPAVAPVGLAVQNRTTVDLSYRFDSTSRHVTVAPGERRGWTAISGGASATIDAGEGTIWIRWQGSRSCIKIDLPKGGSAAVRAFEEWDDCCEVTLLALAPVGPNVDPPSAPPSSVPPTPKPKPHEHEHP